MLVADLVSRLRTYICVDNLGVFVSGVKDTRAGLDAIIANLAGHDLIIHETEVSSAMLEALGTEVDLVQLRAGVTKKRIQRALRIASRRSRLSG